MNESQKNLVYSLEGRENCKSAYWLCRRMIDRIYSKQLLQMNDIRSGIGIANLREDLIRECTDPSDPSKSKSGKNNVARWPIFGHCFEAVLATFDPKGVLFASTSPEGVHAKKDFITLYSADYIVRRMKLLESLSNPIYWMFTTREFDGIKWNSEKTSAMYGGLTLTPDLSDNRTYHFQGYNSEGEKISEAIFRISSIKNEYDLTSPIDNKVKISFRSLNHTLEISY